MLFLFSPPPPEALALCKLGKNSTAELYASARCSSVPSILRKVSM